MIKSIELKNFQSHKQSKLTFDKGINVIIGSSDSGKSAILRALNLVINNKPNGDSYRSDWGGDTYVEVDFGNAIIRRTRTSKENEYALDDSYFKALGGKVPEEIEEAISMNDINMQYQLDAPFLLNETSGQVAQRLNKAVNLDIIDEVNKKIASKEREVKTYIKSEENRIQEYENEYSLYYEIDEIEKSVKKLEIDCVDIDKFKNDLFVLQNLKQQYDTLLPNILILQENIKKHTKLKKCFESLIKQENEIQDIKNKIAIFFNAKNSYNLLTRNILQYNTNIKINTDIIKSLKNLKDKESNIYKDK